MIISIIKQFGLRLRADPEEIPFQHSSNIQMQFIKDENYNDYTVVGYYIPPGENEAKLLSINDDGTFILGPDCFKQRGTLSFSFNLVNSIEEVHLGSIDFEVRYSFGDGDTILPEPEEVWISLVTQVAKDAIREEVALVKQKANEALQSALTASEKANEALEYANNAKDASNSATTAAGQSIIAKDDAIAASNQALGFSNNASESAIEAKNSADEALENANASNKAIETITQIKTEIENKANDFDTNYQEKLKVFNDNSTEKQNAFNQSVIDANNAFNSKVNQANSNLDDKILGANNVIDEKILEATNQANEAKKQAQIATDEVAKVPNLIEGKLDKNLGSKNADKVLVTDSQGNITTQSKEDFEGGGTTDYNELENKPQINGVELKGNITSEQLGIIAKNDNFLYDDVAKSLNPNVTDSFLRAMWNLKMYGQSMQGADPSPSNEQPITAISQFDGAPTGKNLFDIDKVIDGDRLKNNGDGTLTAITSNDDSSASNGQKLSDMANLIVGKTYILNAKTTGTQKQIYLGKTGTIWEFERSRKITQDDLDSIVYFYASGVNTQAIISEIQIELGETATPYTPYVSQPFTYTPTNPMYSTQDGSICDYVDVEKGVEVYQLCAEVLDGSEDENYQFVSTNQAFRYYTKYIIQKPTIKIINMCDSLTVVASNNVSINNGEIVFSYIGELNANVRFKINDDITTVEQLREYLQQNPITIVYVIETPIEIPIPQEQLAMLRSLYTYTGVTNFLCNAPVSFTYERSLQIVINNLENAIGQTNANILLNGGNN